MPLNAPLDPTTKTPGATVDPRGAAGTDTPDTSVPTFSLSTGGPLGASSGGVSPSAGLGASSTPPPANSSFSPPATPFSGSSAFSSGAASPNVTAGIDPNYRPASGTSGTSASGGPVNAPNPFGPNPYLTNPTGANALSGGTIPYNPMWYASPDAAQKLAQMTGGTVVNGAGASGISNNQAQWMVQLPNGQTVYPGTFADLYNNPNSAGNQGIIDSKMAEMLNNNAVGSTDIAHQGLYTVKNGVISYDPNGHAQPTTSMPLSMSQYNAWLTKNALAGATGYGNGNQDQTGNWSTLVGSPGTGAPAVTGAPNAQQLAALQQQYGVQPQAQQQQAATNQNGLQQLLQLFGNQGAQDPLTQLLQALGGGQQPSNSINQSSSTSDLMALMQLIMLMGGDQSGSLYSRSQYPRFP